MTTETIFKNKKPNFEKLKKYGFVKSSDFFTYTTHIANKQFQMQVIIKEDGQISTKVTDLASGEEYVLHRIKESVGAFVGMVKCEHENILLEIAEVCYDVNIYKSAITKQIISYVKETYGDELEFLWQRTPENSILRRKDTGKWYAAILVLSRSKLGMDSEERVEIIDLRMPEGRETVIDNERYFPGYHMNKKHWYTICLDGIVEIEEICQRIDESYKLAR